ncbi:hypothetical protein Tco_1258329 [Tanacetum coccineum]
MNLSEENPVQVNDTSSLKIGFCVVGRKKKPGVALQSPYEQQQSTTPPPVKRRTITSQILESMEFPDEFEVDGEEEEKFESIKFSGVSIVPFSEDLRRHKKCNLYKVYFPLNEPKMHSALAELHIRTGMRETMSKQLPLFLDKIRVLKSKGLLVGEYNITYQFEEKITHQAAVYGDCGVWVCLLLYRLTHKLPLVFGDPIQVAIAYRERMLAYF